jgi:hypothetical protein
MDLNEFKQKTIREKLQIDQYKFGRILTMVDFGNVDYWFEEDRMDFDGSSIKEDEKFSIDLKNLFDFLNCFSAKTKFYFGHDSNKSKSLGFIGAAKDIFVDIM